MMELLIKCAQILQQPVSVHTYQKTDFFFIIRGSHLSCLKKFIPFSGKRKKWIFTLLEKWRIIKCGSRWVL